MDNIGYSCVYGFGKTRKEALEKVYSFRKACWANIYLQIEEKYPEANYVAVYLHVGLPFYREPFIKELCELFSFLEVEYIPGRHAKVVYKIDRKDTVWTHLFLGILRFSWEFISFWPKEYEAISDILTSILIKKRWESSSALHLGHTPFSHGREALRNRMSAKVYANLIIEIITERISFTSTKQSGSSVPSMKTPLYNKCVKLNGKKSVTYDPFT